MIAYGISYDRDTALAEWNKTRTGPMVLPGHLTHIIFVRLLEDAAPFSQLGFVDPAPGNDSPHIEFVFSQISAHPPVSTADIPLPPAGLGGVTIQFSGVNLQPISREFVNSFRRTPLLRESVRWITDPR